MNKKFLLLLTMSVFCENTVLAKTLYGLPLMSHPGKYTGWFDHNSKIGSTKRYDCKTGTAYDKHKGTDFPVVVGTNVVTGAKGTIYSVKSDCPNGPTSGKNADTKSRECGGGFGNHVRVKHADGNVTIYAHLSRIWQPIKYDAYCGYSIGQSGNSGASDGPHLHFELRTSDTGTRLDPFGGSCSGNSYWVNQNDGYPKTACQ